MLESKFRLQLYIFTKLCLNQLKNSLGHFNATVLGFELQALHIAEKIDSISTFVTYNKLLSKTGNNKNISGLLGLRVSHVKATRVIISKTEFLASRQEKLFGKYYSFRSVVIKKDKPLS